MDPSEAPAYINTALEYHNQTLTPFRHAIDAISHENCDAVFAHSVVTTIISIALPQLTTERGEISMIEKIIVAAELLQGVGSISRLCRPWMKFKLFTSQGDFWEESKAPPDRETEAALDSLSALTDEVADVDQRRVLSDTLQTLRRCFARYSSMRDVASPFAWLTVTDKEFFRAVRSRQPMALLILLYWGVLLHDLEGKMWWAKNSGSALILELLAELRPYQSRWENILLWPRKKIGPQGDLARPNGTDIRPSH
jgi:hypothetical protein